MSGMRVLTVCTQHGKPNAMVLTQRVRAAHGVHCRATTTMTAAAMAWPKRALDVPRYHQKSHPASWPLQSIRLPSIHPRLRP